MLRCARRGIALQVVRLGRGCGRAGLRRVDAQRDQRVVTARRHSRCTECIEQIGANDAAEIGAMEVAERKDQWLSIKKI